MSETSLPQSKDISKTRALSEFAVSNTSAMRILRNFGLLRQTGEGREKRAWGKLQGKERSFRNIAEHSLVAGMVTDVVLERLKDNGHLTQDERKRGTKAALMHDMLKRKELEMQYGTEAGDHQVFFDPIQREIINELLLQEHHISQQDIQT